MPGNQKPSEAGWFYHAPAKRQINQPKVEHPAPSQIPGIGFDDPTLLETEEVRPMMFKETDSKYIQLAKMGGRKDLLAFNPELYKKKNNASGYPRNDWFYLEDNRVEDEEKKKEESWDFLLPEYMVHKSYQPSFEDPSAAPMRAGGAPYHTEKGSVLEDEGRSATDKTIKIPEVRRPGFGVRNEKPPATIKSLPRDKVGRPHELDRGQGDKRRAKPNPMAMPSENDEPTMMSKLMSGGYEKDWHDKRAQITTKGEDSSKTQKKQQQPTSGSGQRNEDVTPTRAKTDKEKKLFKLSKFQNVPSRIIAHQAMHPMDVTK